MNDHIMGSWINGIQVSVKIRNGIDKKYD
jgi:hypothetical protein